jgi:hypothetical protein
MRTPYDLGGTLLGILTGSACRMKKPKKGARRERPLLLQARETTLTKQKVVVTGG